MGRPGPACREPARPVAVRRGRWLSRMRKRQPASELIASDAYDLSGLCLLCCLEGERSDALLDRARVMHRAELRPAHAAELRTLEILGRKCLVVIFLSTVRVESEAELFLPVEFVSRPGESVASI